MDQNQQSANRFIFSDAFYDQMENMNNEPKEETESLPVEENKENDIISDSMPGSNTFFNNQTIKTTTVYDSVGNTVSQVVDDGKEEKVIVKEEEPVKEKTIEDNYPDLGIPKPSEMPELVEIKKEDVIEPSIQVEKTNKLDVDTGIDTKLEQQLMSNNQIYTPQNNFFDINPFATQEKVTKYRAVRRPNNYNNKVEEIEDDSLEEKIDVPKVNIKEEWHLDTKPAPVIINEELSYEDEEVVEEKEENVVKSDLIERLIAKEKETGKVSILARYGDDFCSRDYITNPAIGRDKEIKELGLILLTPEKSAILVGKPGIGKTSIVEGLAYQLQRGNVPDALKGYTIVSIKTTSLLGSLTNGETRLQTLIDELKTLDKIILFVDEVHMLMGATNESSLDFANMFKESLGRGSIKMIGATTSDEYERYVLRDKAFVRRFQRVDVNEPSREETIQILMGTLPKIEKTTGARLKYTYYIKTDIMSFIVDITTEYKRVYGIGSRYPDICITLLNQAFSEAVFNNRKEVNIFDIRNAIQNSKNIYPDVIRKELVNFDEKFKNIIEDEKNNQ